MGAHRAHRRALATSVLMASLSLAFALGSLSCGPAAFQGAIPLAGHLANLRAVGGFSPDGARFAVVEARLSPVHAETGVLRIFERGPTPDLPGQWRLATRVRVGDILPLDVAFSPDGTTLAVGGLAHPHSVALWDVAKGRVRRLLPGSKPLTQVLAYGPRGEFLVTAGLDGRVRSWRPSDGRLLATIDDDPALLRQTRFPLVVAPSGAFIAYARTDGRVVRASPTTGRRLDDRPTGAARIFDLACSADARWLAASTDVGILLWDLAGPREGPRVLTRQRAPSIAFTPDSAGLLLSAEAPSRSLVVEVPNGRVRYAILASGREARNDRLLDVPLGAETTRERALWSRLARSFPRQQMDAGVRAILLAYLRAPSIHRVAISPEDLWLAFFEGGRAGLVITKRHYELRRNGAPAPVVPRAPASPSPPSPVRPSAQRERPEGSI